MLSSAENESTQVMHPAGMKKVKVPPTQGLTFWYAHELAQCK